MLDSRAISIGCLLVWTGVILGLLLLAASEVFEIDNLSRWGFVSLLLACTYSVHRNISTRDRRLYEAFEMGRDHERGGRAEVSAIR